MCASHFYFGQVELAEQDRLLLGCIGDGLFRCVADCLGHGRVFVILDPTKILGDEQFLRADNFRPFFRLPFSLGQRGLEVLAGNAGGSGLGQAAGERLFGVWHWGLDAHWPGSREMFAPSARSLPSMFS